MASCCYGTSLSGEIAEQDVTQALFVLKEYTEVAVVLFERWQESAHPCARVSEQEEQDD